MRRGFTLVETTFVLAIAGALLAIALPSLWAWRDRAAVHRAVQDVVAFHQAARFRAVGQARRVRLELGQDSLRAVFEGPPDSLAFAWQGPRRHGVRLAASRSYIRIGPLGLGWGGANTTVVLRRGAAAGSLTTSRLGRLKRW